MTFPVGAESDACMQSLLSNSTIASVAAAPVRRFRFRRRGDVDAALQMT
jgi:hypothetical protein